MDAVRFGRALGIGARQAVKTLVTAVDAATASNPSSKGTGAGRALDKGPRQGPGQIEGQIRVVGGAPVSATSGGVGAAAPEGTSNATKTAARTATKTAARTATKTAAKTAARTVAQAQVAQQRLRHGGRRFGEAVWGPFVRLSGVVWLEVSGVFFGIFALFAGLAMWRLRGAWRESAANAAAHRSFEGAVVMLAVFGYFCVSSFVRARKRERRR